MSILDYLTNDWQTMADIERRAGRPIAAQLQALWMNGKVWRFVDATQRVHVAKYCLPHDVLGMLIGISHVGRMARPVMLNGEPRVYCEATADRRERLKRLGGLPRPVTEGAK